MLERLIARSVRLVTRWLAALGATAEQVLWSLARRRPAVGAIPGLVAMLQRSPRAAPTRSDEPPRLAASLADEPRAMEHEGQLDELAEHQDGGEAARVAIPPEHPDYPYPTVVAVDLEVDPSQEAAGEGVFEVAAVRVKGRTVLAEYHSFVRRGFRPAKVDPARLEHAPSAERVAATLRTFVDGALVVGHNLRAFDAAHLRALGVPIADDQTLDTLTLARLLYPDSLHHSLQALCQAHGIVLDDWHQATADARACALLLQALGDALAERGGALLRGVRALVEPGSGFDRAILQPRGLPADPSLPWELDPRPAPPRVVAALAGQEASRAVVAAVRGGGDALVELDDPDATYASQVPADRRVAVAVATRARLDRILAARRGDADVFVLPEPRTLLCPERLRTLVESADDWERRLTLFCLYQASHNHDAATLYPCRVPSDDPALARRKLDACGWALRADLTRACCPPDEAHRASCPGSAAAREATRQRRVILGTHAAFLHQPEPPDGDLVIVDDVDELQMRLGEHVAETVAGEDPGPEAFEALHRQVVACARDYLPYPQHHERLPLRSFEHYLRACLDTPGLQSRDRCALEALDEALAERLKELCAEARRDPPSPDVVHAHWLDLWFGDGPDHGLERWAIRGLSQDLRQVFARAFWERYRQRVVCGPSVGLGHLGTDFLARSLGLPADLPFTRDERPRAAVLLPEPEVVPPAGFLNRRTWALRVGACLYAWAREPHHSILASPGGVAVADALAAAFVTTRTAHGRAVASPSLGWTVARLAAALADASRPALAVVSPRLRRAHVDAAVDFEATGPLRFLNTRDPLVAAQMRVFASRYPAEGPFRSYLLPQALLELKGRLRSPAKEHVVLDSKLLTRSYRDEALAALSDFADVRPIAELPASSPGQSAYLGALADELERRGFGQREQVRDEDLYLVLRTLWDAAEFRGFPGTTVTQKEVVRGVLEGRDQFLVAATGGGKSLCFQLPAVLLAEELPPRLTLVFSPLIALMANQVEDLNRKGVFQAIMLNSTLSPAQRQEYLRGIRRGDYSIVYLAPEQIHSSGLRRAVQEREVGLVAVDEAHCLSQWGHDFRTEYLQIKKWMDRQLCRGDDRRFPILALTATARQSYLDEDADLSDRMSTVEDVVRQLDLRISVDQVVRSSTKRPELQFRIEQVAPRPLQCHRCHQPMALDGAEATCACGERRRVPETELRAAVEGAKVDRLVSLLTLELQGRWRRPLGERERGLVYCAFRRTTEEVAAMLAERLPELRVAHYHAGVDAGERDEVLRRFTSDGAGGLDLVVATNAFGMGIDVRRLGYVVHFDTPGTLEAYYQEAGRAGRDRLFQAEGSRAQCILLYHPSDLRKQRLLSRRNTITHYQIRDVYDVLRALGAVAEARDDGTREVIVAQRDLAALAGVDEESVAAIVYYLEYHTTANGQPVLERGETASRVWRLRLESGYQDRLADLPADSPSWPLLRQLLESDEFRLDEQTVRAIAAADLVSVCRGSYPRLEAEILNLARRRVVAYACEGQVRWTGSADAARETIEQLRRDVVALVAEVDRRSNRALRSGRSVFVDLDELCSELRLEAVPLSRLARLLFALSTEEAEPLRAFEHFGRVTRSTRPARYELRLWAARGSRSVGEIVREVFRGLVEAVERFARLKVTDDWQRFDIFAVEPDYRRRQALHHQLLVLQMLGLVGYVGDPALSLALRVTLRQPTIAADDLSVDLGVLRLKETYEKHKLRLIARYAEVEEESRRAEAIEGYFRADSPIVERLGRVTRGDLTPAQTSLVRLGGGRHLIEGPAGCGKTTTLVELVKHLVYEEHVALERVMVTTHFNSAIGRIEKQFEVLREDGAAALATTVHSFGQRVFSRHRAVLRRADGHPYFPKEPELLKDGKEAKDRQIALVSKALDRLHRGEWAREPWPEGLGQPTPRGAYLRNATIEERCLTVVDWFRQHGIFPTCDPNPDTIRGLVGAASDYDAPELYAVYATFLELMGEEGSFYTFDDQVLLALAILRTSPELKREYQRFFEYIVIDELQDFSPAAAQLFLELSGLHQNVMAFGDPDQDIRYRAEGAAAVFAELRHLDSCGRAHFLPVNFRSTQEILDLAWHVRNWREPPEAQRPQLVAHGDRRGAKPALVCVRSRLPLPEHEAMRHVADCVLEELGRLDEAEAGKVALIVARRQWRRPLEEILMRRGVSFSILQGKSDYQLSHVDNVLVYLRVIADPRSDDDVAQVLRYCVVPYLTNVQVKLLRDAAKAQRRPLIDVLGDERVLAAAEVTREQRESLVDHLAVLFGFDPESPVGAVGAAVRSIADGPIASLRDQPEKLADVYDALAALGERSVADALAEVKRYVAFLDANQGNVGLVLTTVDHAKSEEFDAVFLIGANHLDVRRQRDVVNKRRLYVGMMRAKERLYLIWDEATGLGSVLSSVPPSAWVKTEWPPTVGETPGESLSPEEIAEEPRPRRRSSARR